MGRQQARPQIGDEQFSVEMIETPAVIALARKQGWTGGDDAEGVREFCEPNEAAVYTIHKTLDSAVKAAREYLAKGTDFYGCVLIDREVFEAAHDDRGNPVECPPSWETHQTYEVAMDGECIEVASGFA